MDTWASKDGCRHETTTKSRFPSSDSCCPGQNSMVSFLSNTELFRWPLCKYNGVYNKTQLLQHAVPLTSGQSLLILDLYLMWISEKPTFIQGPTCYRVLARGRLSFGIFVLIKILTRSILAITGYKNCTKSHQILHVWLVLLHLCTCQSESRKPPMAYDRGSSDHTGDSDIKILTLQMVEI